MALGQRHFQPSACMSRHARAGADRKARIVMPYMLLIVEPVGQRREHSEEEGRKLYDVMMRFSEDLKERGLLQLTPSRCARTSRRCACRCAAGKRKNIDGPFAESKEMVGGFFLLNCNDKAQAVEIAAECPAARWATVEVRELGPCFT
jgi:hypothetical protein